MRYPFITPDITAEAMAEAVIQSAIDYSSCGGFTPIVNTPSTENICSFRG
jgi:hypothetical protein